MLAIVCLLLLAAMLLMMVGYVIMAVEGFQEHVGWGLGTVFCAFPVGIIFSIQFWKQRKWARRGLIAYLSGLGAMLAVCLAIIAAAPVQSAEWSRLQDKEEALNQQRALLFLSGAANDASRAEELAKIDEALLAVQAEQTALFGEVLLGANAPIKPTTVSTSESSADLAALPTGDPFEIAMNLATEAESQLQTAETKADWAAIANTWQLSVTLLERVPNNHPHYATAQTKIMIHNHNKTYAESNAQ